jgi:sterol 24-C-methyltransferase
MVDKAVTAASILGAFDLFYLLQVKGESVPLNVSAFLEAYHKRDAASQTAMVSLVGASVVLGALVINHAFGTDPLGRTKDMFSKFAVQEKKRNIRVDDWIETYNSLHDDAKEGVEARNSSYTTLVNSYYELATLFYEWGM